MTRRTAAVAVVLAAASLVVAVALVLKIERPVASAEADKEGGTITARAGAALTRSVEPAPAKNSGGHTAALDAGPAPRPDGTFATASWGSGPEQLGHDRPQEGNPEAPMSLTLDSSGNAVVLDQVNGRLVRYGKDGQWLGTVPLSVQGAQDLALSGDGTLVVLDRLVDKTVALMDPDGKLRGELPLEGKGIAESGAVTGIFVDGQDVYAEREHGNLVRIGDTSGKTDPERPEIPGRPSRDGLSYLTAGLTDPPAGRLYVSSIIRQTREHRFTRELRMGVPLHGLVLLDTDRAGVIYLGILAEVASGTPGVRPAILLTCLDPLDGRPLGKVELPANTSPDETFRELTVFDQGGVLYALRSESGVTMQRHDCR